MTKKKILFKRVAIIGTGLIGGSLALALRKNNLVGEIVGIARHKETLRLAERIRAVDFATTDIRAVKNADLIIFATPVEVVLTLAKKITRIAKKECVLFDVGSTKEKIVLALEKLFPNYIGTHPLAGSQKYGIKYAQADLFQHSLCVLTPTAKTKKKVQRIVKNLWERLGAKVVTISAKRHDKIIAFVSHLPHAVAFTLMELMPDEYLNFAASGLKDTTRIAASHPVLWRDIFFTNRKATLKTLKAFEKSLCKFKSLLLTRDRRGLYRFLLRAKTKRQGLG